MLYKSYAARGYRPAFIQFVAWNKILFIYFCKWFFLDIINGLKNNEFTALDKTDILAFLERAFVRLEAWFHWFHTTQSGMLYKCTYVLIVRWKYIVFLNFHHPLLLLPGKQMSSYYWHGRNNKTIYELNPKVHAFFLALYLCAISIRTIRIAQQINLTKTTTAMPQIEAMLNTIISGCVCYLRKSSVSLMKTHEK